MIEPKEKRRPPVFGEAGERRADHADALLIEERGLRGAHAADRFMGFVARLVRDEDAPVAHPGAPHLQRHVARDREEPRHRSPAVVERAEAAVGAAERLLGRVRGQGGVAEEVAQEAVDGGGVARVQLRERRAIVGVRAGAYAFAPFAGLRPRFGERHGQ